MSYYSDSNYAEICMDWCPNSGQTCATTNSAISSSSTSVNPTASLLLEVTAGDLLVVGEPLIHDEPSRLGKEGGPYADALMFSFPKENAGKILSEIRRLKPDNVDSYNELLARAGPVITAVLTWD